MVRRALRHSTFENRILYGGLEDNGTRVPEAKSGFAGVTVGWEGFPPGRRKTRSKSTNYALEEDEDEEVRGVW